MLSEEERARKGGERFAGAVVAAIIGAGGLLLVEITDFLFWDMGWVEAATLGEYLRKTWILPVLAGVVLFFIYLWKGDKASSIVEEIWDFFKY